MDNFRILKYKLRAFIKKFYLNELLKGLILFLAIGLILIIVTLFIEYLFWFTPTVRSLLFWSFIGIEAILFGMFILQPLLKLLRISKGIDEVEASVIIGKHFPEVRDKLLNVLQLRKSTEQTELLLAGIDQKAQELKPIPFSMAVDLRKNLRYWKYAAIPVLVIFLVTVLGKVEIFTDSYKRVVNYNVVYHPPAPFSFRLRNSDLQILENEPLTIEVLVEGKTIPENISIHYKGQTYFLNQVSPGIFRYVFEPVQESFEFYLSGNRVSSKPYLVKVITVPKIQNLKMEIDYPEHTSLIDEVIDGTGNATVPEGTHIKWMLHTRSTENVKINFPDTVQDFFSGNNIYSFSKQFLTSADYRISTSNQDIQNFEKLSYSIRVIKDEFPKLFLEHRIDTLKGETLYFYGKVSDDHGISRVRLVAFPLDNPEDKIIRRIETGNGAVGEFLAVFPDTLHLKKGKEYELFFEVIDNDVVNGFKKIKSRSFFFRKRTEQEETEERLREQNYLLEDLGRTLQELEYSERELEELSRMPNERRTLNYKERKRLENFLQRQREQNKLMGSYTKKLRESLGEEEISYDNDIKKSLQNRLDQREEELREQENMLEELERYADKIDEEGLKERLEEFSKGSDARQRNLEQLLELTKRYYVQKKVAQLAEKLNNLGDVQKTLAVTEKRGETAIQDSLNKETKNIIEELKDLKEENRDLRKPIELGNDEKTEKEISKDQKSALQKLSNGDKAGAKKEQEKAGEKLERLAHKMRDQIEMSGMVQMQEDVDMLRQILDNLLTFSFEQEEVMEDFKRRGSSSFSFSPMLKEQHFLKENFKHIDDSIYALALRNPMITENITNKLVDVGYNLDKALERLSQDNVVQGVSSQQYIVTGANDLAYFLSKVLGNMEKIMAQAKGQGSGGDGMGMQLPDIIQKQEGLNERMQDGVQGGEKNGNGIEEKNEKQGDSEKTSEELFRIFKEQQMLRRALEQKLGDRGENSKPGHLLREMKEIENEMLQKGFNSGTLDRMKRLEHKLLELDEAELLQGEKKEREAETNRERFESPDLSPLMKAKEYFNTTEILNRQTLPLRQIYRLKVKDYFERGNH